MTAAILTIQAELQAQKTLKLITTVLKSYFYTLFNKKVKGVYSCSWEPISQLWGVTCHLGSHSVTCNPTQANAPRPNPSQTDKPVVDLPTPEGWKAELI